MPKYSVIIPLYNKERHIAETIQSVLSQDLDDYEILVVNDGSTDNSLSVVNAVSDSRLRVIDKENGGVSSARNKGIEEAKGDYVAFLDADDKWLPNHLTSFDRMMSEYPDAGLYATAYQIVSENGEMLEPFRAHPVVEGAIGSINFFKESYQDVLLPVHTSATCALTKVVRELGGFIEGCPLGEDLDMWGRIALKYDVVVNSLPSSVYYKDTDNRSTGVVYDKDYPFVKLWKSMSLEEKHTCDPYVKEFVAMQQFMLAAMLVKRGMTSKARAYLATVDTDMQRKKWMIYYISSFMPRTLIDRVIEIKRKYIGPLANS